MRRTGMSEYIEREAAKLRIFEYGVKHRDNANIASACEILERQINSIPAADARPVVRGKWIDYQQGRWVYAKCSECETVHDVRSNFCPNCGADMREES
jgi:hypothetical protein